MVRVVVGIVPDKHKNILVTQRPLQKTYSGYWEFPGGKIEPEESAYQALVRELQEELNIQVQAATPWRSFEYRYPEKVVDLELWIVTSFAGELQGMENQAFQWVSLENLATIDFLPANKMILAEMVQFFSKNSG